MHPDSHTSETSRHSETINATETKRQGSGKSLVEFVAVGELCKARPAVTNCCYTLNMEKHNVQRDVFGHGHGPRRQYLEARLCLWQQRPFPFARV
jgi:hypothetical protein